MLTCPSAFTSVRPLLLEASGGTASLRGFTSLEPYRGPGQSSPPGVKLIHLQVGGCLSFPVLLSA